MRNALTISLFLFCLTASAQHPVIAVLEDMKDRDYQFEISGVHKIPMKIKDKYDTIKLIENYEIAKVGTYATYHALHKNPDDVFLISDGEVITTVDLDPTFSNSACLQVRGFWMFPYVLLDDFFHREVLSPNDMKFIGQDSSSFELRAENGRLVLWRGFDVLDFQLDQVDNFKDPEKLNIEISSERECADILSNIRKMRNTTQALKVE
ncbi:MAG: hypothetical protein R8G66_09210 [Cytophagales bacterium]|nr:hypothetical protein [Cytophagales bacterium]